MPDLNASTRAVRTGSLPLYVMLPLAVLVTLVFVAILFPWDAIARRLAFEIGAASGARVSLEELAPTVTARGPVLRARNVVIEHPSVRVLRVSVLEVAPRFSTSWLHGEPRLRIFADSELGVVDGVLLLGPAPAFDGRVQRVAIERLPLRLDAAGMRVAGELAAEAERRARSGRHTARPRRLRFPGAPLRGEPDPPSPSSFPEQPARSRSSRAARPGSRT